jgi:Immunity protein 53
MTTSGALGALAQWYAAHCDGEWEHSYGITLETLDNPGWSLSIDLVGTELEHVPFPPIDHQLQHPTSWRRCWRDGAAFHAACGLNELNAVLDTFTAWANADRSGA